MLVKYLLDKFFEKTRGFYPFFKYCPKKYKIHYFNKRASQTLGYEYNFLTPKTFNEKVMWLAYNEKLELKTLLTDKIKVKDYINEKLGEGHCAQIYGVWDDFNDIDFSKLPSVSVLKVNNSWKKNLTLINNLSNKQKKELKKLVNKWLKMNYFDYSLEPQYENIKPKIFAEKLLLDSSLFEEYQVHCFNGQPIMIEVLELKNKEFGFTFYDLEWKKLPYKLKQFFEKDAKKPESLELIIEYAKRLSEEFSYVRVDFLVSKAGIFVLELTFTPHSAMMAFCDNMVDENLGSMLKLPALKNEKFV